ncbi:MAG: hypothetical protein ACREIA_23645 [Opitutaceae bacterium]
MARAVPLEYWDYRTPSSVGETLRGVAYDGAKFIAVGEGGTLLVSQNGVHWADITPHDFEEGAHKASLFQVTHQNGTWFAFGTRWGSYSAIFTSNNGFDWDFPNVGSSRIDTDVGFFKGLYFWLCDNGAIEQSSTGIFPRSNPNVPAFGRYNAIATNDVVAVAVGEHGAIAYSANGALWAPATSGITSALKDVAFLGDAFYAVGANGIILTSPDGIVWTKTHESMNATFEAVTRMGDTRIVVGQGGRIYRSLDGAGWTAVADVPNANYYDVAAGSGRFVAVGEGGLRLSSADGQSWAGYVPDRPVFTMSVATNGKSIVTPPLSAGRGYYSTDGINWRRSEAPGGLGTRRVVWFKDHYYTGGSKGVNARSVDGAVWEAIASPREDSIAFLGAAGASLIVCYDWDAIGNPGQIRFLTQECGAFTLPDGSKDAALVLYLAPGSYTAHLGDASNATGTALVEVYLLD